MPQMGSLLWMLLLCLNIFLLHLLILSIHFSIMISPRTKKNFFYNFFNMNDLIYTKLAYFIFTLNVHKI